MQRLASTTISEVTQATSKNTNGCVFFLHGSCDNGSGLKSWLHKILDKDFTFKSCRVVYPSAPKLAYFPHGNKPESVWFNRFSLHHDAPEDLGSINGTAKELSKLILEENKASGIPLSKMVIGGFSSGGSIALHLGYRFHPQLAGVFALSSYVPQHSIIFEHLEEQKNSPVKQLVVEKPSSKPDCISIPIPYEETLDSIRKPNVDFMQPLIQKYLTKGKENNLKPQMPKLLMSQGFEDPLVKPRWAKSTFKKLLTYDVDGLFYSYPTMKHDICKTELDLLHIWIEDVIKNAEEPPSSPSTNGSLNLITLTNYNLPTIH